MYIYCITNVVNDKIYVGQHAGEDLEAYFAVNLRHAFVPSRQFNKPTLYRAIRKYGPASFTISALVRAYDKSQANLLEQFFIRTLDSRNSQVGYNIAAGGNGGNTSEGRTHSNSTKQKIRQAHQGKPKSAKHRQQLSIAKTGKPCPSVVLSNIRRRSDNPTPSALRNRRYREKLKNNGAIRTKRKSS